MSATVEVVSGLQRLIKVSISAEAMSKDYDQKLQKYKKTIKIKGFRPGKVPPSVIEKKYGSSIRAELQDEVIRKSLTQAIEENELNLAGMPEIKPQEWNLGEPMDFEASCEIYPDVELPDLTALDATRYAVEITEADIEKTLGSVADQQKTWVEQEKKAESGDRVIIDFSGTINGEVFPGGEATDFQVEIGANQMIPGFEEGLIGIEKDISRELRLVFPEDYHATEVAGQSAEFAVTAKAVQVSQRPELDDELAKKVGVEGGLDALKDIIRERMEKEASNALRGMQKEGLLDQLLDKTPFDVPGSLLENEVKYLQDVAKQQAISKGELKKEDAENTTFPAEDYQEQATKRVRLGLLLSAVIKHFDITVDKKKVQERVEQIAMSYPQPAELLNWLYKSKERMAEIETAVIEDQAIEALLDGLSSEPETVGYEKAVEMAKAAQEKADSSDE